MTILEREYLVEIDARDASGATVTQRFSRDGYMTRRTDSPADTPYPPRVEDPGALSLYLWGAGTTGGSSEVGWGTISLHNEDGGLDSWLEDGYGFAGVAVRVKIGEPGAALSSFSAIFTGTVERVEYGNDGKVRVAVRDRQHLLSVAPLQDVLFAGDNVQPNGVEGLARDLKGKGKPRLYGGKSRNFAPPLVNAQRLIYQVSDKAVASVDAVYDRASPLTVGAQMTYAAMTGNLVVTSYSANFNSTNVNTSTDAIAITGATFNAGDRCTLSHGTFNPFPGGISLNTNPRSWNQSRSYYGVGRASLRIYTTLALAQADADGTEVNLTSTGTAGITFSAAYAGYTFYFTSSSVDTANDRINLGDPDIFAPNAVPITFSFPASTPILPAPLQTATDYYLSGTAAAVKFHLTYADAVAGTNAINLTTTGQTGVTCTATIYTTGVEMDTFVESDDNNINTTTDEITTLTAHGITNGDPVTIRLKTTGALPAGLNSTTYYYARRVSDTVITLHSSATGASANTGKINITSVGSTSVAERYQISRTRVIPGTFCWCSDATEGAYIRLGTKPTGLLTADATAQSAAADQTVAQVIEAIALDAGITAGDIESTDITALDAAAPQAVAEYLATGDMRSARAVMDAVAESVGAWYAFDATGKLRMGVIAGPSGTPSLTLTEDSIYEVERTQAGDDGSGVPTWRCTVRYAPSLTVQDADQLAGAATDDQAAFVSRDYREASSEDEAVLDVHPAAPERMFTTRLVEESAATDMAITKQGLYGVRRDLLRVRVPLTAAVAAARLGQVVSITWPRLGLSAGRLTLLIGMETEWARDQATLLLWG